MWIERVVSETVQRLSIVVAGHICLDMTPLFSEDASAILADMMRPGRLNYVGPLAMSTGGAVSNVGIALVRLGADVKMVAKVGDDSLGLAVLDIVGQYCPNARTTIRRGGNTSYTVVLAPPGTDRVFLHHPGCNDTFTLADLDINGLSESCIFHFGYPPLMRSMYVDGGAELQRILSAVKAAGLTVSLDLAMFDPCSEAALQDWRLILRSALPFVDVFLPSLEECVMMMRPQEYREFCSYSDDERDSAAPALACSLAHEFVDMGAAVAGIKCGALGYCVVTGRRDRLTRMGHCIPPEVERWSDREIWSPAYAASTIKSANGAGDASIAGFLMGLAKGESIETVANAACAVGWQNLRAVDAFSGVGTWDETMQIVSSAQPRTPVRLGDGWHWSAELGVWLGPRDGR
jgi:sugar/nucleoside kinase (ribokinase family)